MAQTTVEDSLAVVQYFEGWLSIQIQNPHVVGQIDGVLFYALTDTDYEVMLLPSPGGRQQRHTEGRKGYPDFGFATPQVGVRYRSVGLWQDRGVASDLLMTNWRDKVDRCFDPPSDHQVWITNLVDVITGNMAFELEYEIRFMKHPTWPGRMQE